MKLLIVDQEPDGDGGIRLDRDQRNRLLKVLRKRPGEIIPIAHAVTGQRWDAVLGPDGGFLEVTRDCGFDPEPAFSLVLGIGWIRGPQLELAVESLTAMGVDRIVLLQTARTVREGGEGRLDRLNRLVTKTREQSGRSRPIRIDQQLEPGAWLDSLDPAETFVFTALARPEPIQVHDWPPPLPRPPRQGSIVGLIGPEGDFSDEEVSSLVRRGARPVRLRTPILRTELAAIVVGTLLLGRMGRL